MKKRVGREIHAKSEEYASNCYQDSRREEDIQESAFNKKQFPDFESYKSIGEPPELAEGAPLSRQENWLFEPFDFSPCLRTGGLKT